MLAKTNRFGQVVRGCCASRITDMDVLNRSEDEVCKLSRVDRAQRAGRSSKRPGPSKH